MNAFYLHLFRCVGSMHASTPLTAHLPHSTPFFNHCSKPEVLMFALRAVFCLGMVSRFPIAAQCSGFKGRSLKASL